MVAGEDRYTLKFRAKDYGEAEDVIGMSAGELEQAFKAGHVGFNTLHGLVWGATRKYHKTDLPNDDAVWDVLQEIMEAGQYQEAWKTVIEAYGAGQDPQAFQAKIEANENGSQDSPKVKRGKAKVTAVPEPEASTGSGS